MAQLSDTHKLDLIPYSLREEALQLKEVLISPFYEELAFKKLESYTQGINQPSCSFNNEVLTLCAEVDPTMSESIKLKSLLNKARLNMQFEIRRKKPTTTKQFLEYAKKIEEFFQLSNINTAAINTNHNSGFYRIPINETDKEKNAFVTSFELYQFNVFPMELKNSPSTFQKVVTNTLKSCHQLLLVNLDDIVVFSKSYEDHLTHFKYFWTPLTDRSFVLNPPKFELLVSQINYLGHTNIEEVIYISGRRNCSPDYLSKYSREQDDDLFDIEYGLNSKNEPEQVASSIGKVLATMVL
ncbi:unnamed protein product [Rotaria sp. Silwood2]|nr:unnamed protein product [Rotaria sp. Silwood2]